jgi:thymidylate kinase
MPPPPVTSIALVGIDGAGKSTIAALLADGLAAPARVVYMGVNVETSSLMLPTTRLAVELKRRRGGRPDLTPRFDRSADAGNIVGRLVGTLRTTALLGNWIAEEWFRQAVAAWHQGRGRLVIFDRHIAYDAISADDGQAVAGQPLAQRLHRRLLERFYPRPDLVVCLDGPAEELLRRKGDASPGDSGMLEARRARYLRLVEASPRYAVVDATQPREDVVTQVTGLVERLLTEGRATAEGAATRPGEAR